jgi:hypothetical protein
MSFPVPVGKFDGLDAEIKKINSDRLGFANGLEVLLGVLGSPTMRYISQNVFSDAPAVEPPKSVSPSIDGVNNTSGSTDTVSSEHTVKT